jgi:hypothetical protein
MTKPTRILMDYAEQTQTEDGIEHDQARGTAMFESGLLIQAQPCRLFITAIDRTQSLSAFLYPPFRVRPDKLIDACVLANTINLHAGHSHLEIDPRSGQIRAVSSQDLDGCDANVQAVRNLLSAVNTLLERHMAALAEVALTGRTAGEIQSALATHESAARDEDVRADFDADIETLRAAQGVLH